MRLSEEGEVADLWQTGLSEKYMTVYTVALRAPDWELCSKVCKGAGAWRLENRPRGRNPVGCGKTDREDGREEICIRECLWRKTGLPWKQDATAESHAQGGATVVTSLSPHASACRQQ